jgi:hypothetical protein
MSYPWFRFYDEVVDDPKVQRLPDRLFKAWINVMCIANKSSHSKGILPPVQDIAFRLHISEAKTETIITELIKAGLIECAGSVLSCHNWTGRQFQSDVSTDRVKRFRNAKRNVSETQSGNAPDQIRPDPPMVPPQKSSSIKKEYSDEFERFWLSYPRHAGKGAAFKAWQKIKPSLAMQEIILQAVEKQKQSRQWIKQSGEFIPHASTWLNESRWDDDMVAVDQSKPLSVHDFL